MYPPFNLVDYCHHPVLLQTGKKENNFYLIRNFSSSAVGGGGQRLMNSYFAEKYKLDYSLRYLFEKKKKKSFSSNGYPVMVLVLYELKIKHIKI